MADYKWKVPFKGRQINRQAYVALSLGIEAFAVNCWSHARQIVPKDTWSLRNSIRIMKWQGVSQNWVRYKVLAGAGDIAGSGFRTIGAGGGGVGVGFTRATKGKSWREPYYALYVELGTVRMKAQPFMRPAFNKNKYKLKALVRKIMGRSFTGGPSSLGYRRKNI